MMIPVRPMTGLIYAVSMVALAVGGIYFGVQCEPVIRPCYDTCTRVAYHCGAHRDDCIDACEELDENTYRGFAECAWNAPTNACRELLECWPGDGPLPY